MKFEVNDNFDIEIDWGIVDVTALLSLSVFDFSSGCLNEILELRVYKWSFTIYLWDFR